MTRSEEIDLIVENVKEGYGLTHLPRLDPMFDDACLGLLEIHTLPVRLAYDRRKVIEILMHGEDTEEAYQDALEDFGFNYECYWDGENTYAFLDPLETQPNNQTK
jgi:hypothetical protein